MIEQAKAHLSHKTGGGLKEALLEMAAQTLRSHKAKKDHDLKKATATVAALKSVTPKLRREILERDKCCQFKDPQSGRACGSKYFLEVDHIQPQSADGKHIPENLRVLCSAHNKFRYLHENRAN